MRKFSLTTILVAFAAAAASPALAQKQRLMTPDGNLDALIARHAAANNIPEDLVRRVIKRESGGNPRAVSKGNFGLMQIKLASARVITKAPPPRSSFATAAMGHFCHVAVR